MENVENEIMIEFNDNIYNVKIESDKEINVNMTECINYLNSMELWDYLYNYHMDMFDEINSDPYFEGKSIKCGEDLRNSIEKISSIVCKNDVIYICGEYWCDPEHGFSIVLPNGKFIKSNYNAFEYHRDMGKEIGFVPNCTLLGQFETL